MVNYLKLHFSYLFSPIFSTIFLIILAILTGGIIYNTNLELSYQELDCFRNLYYQEYILQSVSIIELLVVIIGIFISGVLTQKSNDFLFYYVSNTKNKFLFYLSRYILMLLMSILITMIAFICLWSCAIILTPFPITFKFIFDIWKIVLIEVMFYQVFVSLLSVFIKHILVMICPIVFFWYQKTIYDFNEFYSFQKTLFKIVPIFKIENMNLVIYSEITNYIAVIIITIIINIVIDIMKDCH